MSDAPSTKSIDDATKEGDANGMLGMQQWMTKLNPGLVFRPHCKGNYPSICW